MQEHNENPSNGQDNQPPKGDFYGSDFREYKAPPQGEPKDNRYIYEPVMEDMLHPKTQAYSIVALVAGIASVVTCCSGIFAIAAGCVAMILAIVARKHLGYFDTKALLGLIFGIFGTVLGAVLLISILSYGFDEIFRDAFQDQPPAPVPPFDNGNSI